MLATDLGKPVPVALSYELLQGTGVWEGTPGGGPEEQEARQVWPVRFQS